MYGLPLRKGFSLKVRQGIMLNRPDMHEIAEELGVTENDVFIKDGVLTIYNTSAACQEVVDDNALAVFVAMAVDISPDDLSDLEEVEEEPMKMDFDLADFEDDD